MDWGYFIVGVGAALSGALLYRNWAVFKVRRQIINEATTTEQLDWLDRVSYDTMVWNFWKPVKSFYRDWEASK